MDNRLLLGSLVALVSAASFALNVTLSRLVYDHGGNIHALNLARPLIFLVCLALWLRAEGRPLGLPRGPRLASLGLGLLLCVEMYSLLGAIVFMPVGLAVLGMYSYPLLIAAWSWARGTEKPSVPALFALVAAFAGLALALGSSTEGLDWRGVGLAFVAALGMVGLLLIGERVMARRDNRVVMLHMTAMASGVVALLSVSLVDLAWPVGSVGWLAFAGSSLFYVLATFLLFTALKMIGPLRTAVLDNSAPIWAVIFAFWLLGEAMTTTQIIGAALVVAALVTLQIVQKRKPGASPPGAAAETHTGVIREARPSAGPRGGGRDRSRGCSGASRDSRRR